jgi:hypothetical protein
MSERKKMFNEKQAKISHENCSLYVGCKKIHVAVGKYFKLIAFFISECNFLRKWSKFAGH